MPADPATSSARRRHVHHALEDAAVTGATAAPTVVWAAPSNQLRAIRRASLGHAGGMRIRMEGGLEVHLDVPSDDDLGRAERLRDGTHAGVVDLHPISPLDTEDVLVAGRDTLAVLTVDAHNRSGGLGSAVAAGFTSRS